MQTLQEVQKNFISMGFDPKLKQFNHRILRILVINSTALMLQWTYLIHEAESAQEYMESFYLVTANSNLFFMYASTIFNKKKLFSFIKRIDELLNDGLKNQTSKAIYEQANEFVEKWSKVGFFFVKYVLVQCFVFPKAIASFLIYFNTDLGEDAFKLPVLIWIPYDWKNPIGYLVTVFMQSIWITFPSLFNGCITILSLSVFVFAIAIVKNLKKELHSVNKMARHKISRKNVYKKLSETLQTHANAKQLVISFSDLNRIILTLDFIGFIICLCVAMLLFQIELAHSETDSIVLLEAAFFGVLALTLLLIVCEVGQRVTNAIEEIDDVITQFTWYLFPSKIQRLLPIVMQSAQKPTVIRCFGNVSCTRKQFRKVMKFIYSNFMVLREFYK